MAVHLIVGGEPVNSFRDTRGRQRSQCLAGALVNASQPQGIPAGVESGLTVTSFANLTHMSIMRAESLYSKFLSCTFSADRPPYRHFPAFDIANAQLTGMQRRPILFLNVRL
ncbi:MAG: hypothetical protein AAB325_12805 [Pseudomonadota bacterium]